jgi:hypothetical protein
VSDKFTMATIERVIIWADDGSEDYSDESDWSSEFTGVSFRQALDALCGGCWDSVDWRTDEVLAYPADSHHDYRTGEYTGEYTSESLVIKSPRPEWIDRLARAYDAAMAK